MANLRFTPVPRCRDWAHLPASFVHGARLKHHGAHRPDRSSRKPAQVRGSAVQRQVLFALAVAGALAAVAAITTGPVTLF